MYNLLRHVGCVGVEVAAECILLKHQRGSDMVYLGVDRIHPHIRSIWEVPAG